MRPARPARTATRRPRPRRPSRAERRSQAGVRRRSCRPRRTPSRSRPRRGSWSDASRPEAPRPPRACLAAPAVPALADARPAAHNPSMTRRTTGEPLPLQFAPTASRLPERIVPMRPTEGEGPFDDPRYFFEPWWPGIRAFVLVEDGTVRLRAEVLGDPTAAFPELAGVTELVRSDGVVLDATLMVLDARGRPSRTLLEQRLAGEGGTCSSGGPALAGEALLKERPAWAAARVEHHE